MGNFFYYVRNRFFLMKFMPLILIGTAVGTSQNVKAQYAATNDTFEGYWAGNVSESSGDKSISLVIRISNGVARQLKYSSSNDQFEELDVYKNSSTMLANNFVYTWINKSDIWTETHTHLLSYLRPDAMFCRFIRQVNNKQEDKDVAGVNDEWGQVYTGVLKHYSSAKEVLASLE